jgi:hypothetical protein
VRLKYIGAGTVSLVAFLLVTACGQGGSAGSGPPSLDEDGVPDSYDDLPPPTEVVPGDPNQPIPPITDGVPNNQGDPPPGTGVSCRQYCTAILATACVSTEQGQEISVGDCTTICNSEILPQPCSQQLLDVSLCLIAFLPEDSCDFEELPEEELLAACYTPLMDYVECADLDTGEDPDPPSEGTVDCTCACACEYGCSGTNTQTCSASGAQACALCDDSCNSYCIQQDCGASLIPAATPASCVGR